MSAPTKKPEYETTPYGSIRVRVVVFGTKPAPAGQAVPPAAAASTPADDDDDSAVKRDAPLDSYMEREHGKMSIVFLVNGQRHDSLDSTFIAKDLGFKYLRNRTMVIVDLDGLAPEAIAEVVQGSRQGLYAGTVYHAIIRRIVAALKRDPDLERLQNEAEQQIAELGTGDEAVREKLDQLIEEHHTAAQRVAVGAAESGASSSGRPTWSGEGEQAIVVEAVDGRGVPASEPLIVIVPGADPIRLRAGVEREITVRAQPEAAWAGLEDLLVRHDPPVEGLTIVATRGATAAELKLVFREPENFDSEQYPIETELRVAAKFKGVPEVRVATRAIVIAEYQERDRPPPKPPLLKKVPTFLRTTSRQPVILIPGGDSTHVKMRWDGEDSLVLGSPPAWRFNVRCKSLSSFPTPSVGTPRQGRFEILLDPPRGLLPGTVLEFEVQCVGPRGASLPSVTINGVVAEVVPPEPRRVTAVAPQFAGQRRPPYDLRIVAEADWENVPFTWGSRAWTKDEAACFVEPSRGDPLKLLINNDTEGLKALRAEFAKRKLDEATVKRRMNRYTTHVAFHLYQMYRDAQRQREQPDREAQPVDELALRDEINRLATTLLRLMDAAE